MNYDLKISQLEKEITRLKEMLSGKGKVVCHGKEFHVDSTIKLSEVIRRADRFVDGDDIIISGDNVSVSGNNINIDSQNDGDININTNGSGNVFINGVNVKNPQVDSVSFNLQPETVPVGEGVLSYNEADRALELQIGNDVTLSINEELPIDLLNKLGSQINNGKLVYINGAQGNRATAGYASNATCATASKTIAMATENIADNQRGKCTTIGRVKGLNTQGIAEGSELWLGTNGDWTATKPIAGTPRVRIGWVLKEHVSDGWVFVYIQQDKYMFGDRDNGNYSIFEDNGFLEFKGTAVPYRDIDFPVIIRNTGIWIPTIQPFKGNLKAPQWQIGDYYDADDQELIHEWKQESTIYWHLHMWTAVQDATDRWVNWQIEWTFANIGSAAAANQTQSSGNYLITANTLAFTHIIIPVYTWVVPAGTKIAAHVKARLDRIANTGGAANPSVNPFCSKFQMHVQCNTGGSRNLTTK